MMYITDTKLANENLDNCIAFYLLYGGGLNYNRDPRVDKILALIVDNRGDRLRLNFLGMWIVFLLDYHPEINCMEILFPLMKEGRNDGFDIWGRQ